MPAPTTALEPPETAPPPDRASGGAVPASQSPALRDYLGRVRSHLPVGAAPDILRELESSILDRVDALALSEDRLPDEDLVRRALAEVGEPETVAGAYVPQRHLVAPEHYRAFLVTAAVVFAVHLALLAIATMLGQDLRFGPIGVSPVVPGFLPVLTAVVHAVLLDLGLVLAIFWASRRSGGVARIVPESLRVDVSRRAVVGRIAFAGITALLVGPLRDRLFVVADGSVVHPLVTPWGAGIAPWIYGLLAAAILTDGLYLLRGETRTTLAADALHGVGTLAVMLHLARGEALLALPNVSAFDPFRAPVNGLLADLGTLLFAVVALAAAAKTVRRLARASQV